MLHPLCRLSAVRLARMIREGEVSSREVVEAHIARVGEVNPRLNLVVATRFAEARAEASAADVRLRDESPERLPAFHGVPCTVKECFAVRGMPHTSGLVSRRGVVARKDATAVARLRAAGAIPLGVTNTSELCMWMETHNHIYGRSRNPYDSGRIVGGSSGGEGGIVGAGASPFGLAADIGGSIRMPAFFNGVFGHKPTGGLAPSTGQFPSAHGDARRLLTTGPIARRAEDLWPLLRLVAGPDGEDPSCRGDLRLGDPETVRIEDLTVLHVPSNGVKDPSAELREAQRRAVAALGRAGARVERPSFPALRHSMFIWSSRLSAGGGPTYAELLGGGRPIRLWWEILRSLWGGSPHTIPSLGLAALEKIPPLLPDHRADFVALGETLRRELVERLGERGVMLFPSFPRPAPRHHTPLFPPFQWLYTCIFNALELPSTQVPLGLNPRGLPLGVQVVAGPGKDHLTVAVALFLERIFGGWVPPPR